MRAVLYARSAASEAIEARLSEIAGLELVVCGTARNAADAIMDADALLLPQSFYEDAVASAVGASPRLRWIQLLSAGYEKLLGHSMPSGVVVTSAGPGFSGAVADHALALLISLTRCIPQAIANQNKRSWNPAPLAGAICLEGRTALVVGFGSIGQRIGRRLRGFGMTVWGVNRSGAPHPLADGMYTLDRLDEAVGMADVIVIALPQTPQTEKLFDRHRIGRCKPGAILVNIGRGSIIDLAALSDALASGRIGGAGLDVTDPEPLPSDHPFWSAPNLVITPHTGGQGGHTDLANFVAQNVAAFIAGKPLESRISTNAP